MDIRQKKSALSSALLLGLSLCYGATVHAAKPINLNKQNVSVLQSFITSPTAAAINGGVKVEETSRSVDNRQTVHVRIQETYMGYPVLGADAVVHVPNGAKAAKSLTGVMGAAKDKTTMNGTIYQGLEADLVNTPHYVFEKSQAEKALQQGIADYQSKVGKKFDVSDQKTKLVIYLDKDNKAHWAYQVSFFAAPTKDDQEPAVPAYIMDATSFHIYQHWNDLKTLDTVALEDAFGGGFGGNKKMGKLVYDGLSGHLPKLDIQRDSETNMCYLKNNDVVVKNCTSFSGRCYKSVDFSVACDAANANHNGVYWNGDLDAVNDGYSPSNDALFGGMVIKGMYQDWYGVPVLTENGKPMKLTMVVHLPKYDNAYWSNGAMHFGDGKKTFYPLTSLGVAAHEISHGFTEQHSGLAYYGHSGGMNEAFSDMAAQAAEIYAYGENSWQIGPEIFKASGKALRYMDQPSKDCNGKQPGGNSYDQCSIDDFSQYYSGLDVHYSSGLFNRAFYTLGTTEGWDVRKAFDVMANANMHYWTSSSTFAEGACGAVQAAKALNYDTDAVKAAFETVGIKLDSSCKA